MAEVLNTEAVRDGLARLDGWAGDPVAISRTVDLRSFPEAIAVVNRVAAVAEELNHHPDVDIRWRTVTFRCATGSQGGVTGLDLDLARRIDEIIKDAVA